MTKQFTPEDFEFNSIMIIDDPICPDCGEDVNECICDED